MTAGYVILAWAVVVQSSSSGLDRHPEHELRLVIAQLAPPEPAVETPRREEVAAVVNGEMIYGHEVDRELTIAFRDRPVDPKVRDRLRAKTLEQLIRRRLVQRWLSETKQGASQAEIDSQQEQLRSRLSQRGVTLDDFLRQQKLDEVGLRRSLAWQISWGRFLERQQTDANLERYFQKHHRNFDGTEVHVAHILLPVDQNDPPAHSAAEAKARQILERIRAGAESFADAARENSSGPSRAEGGDIGWIGRREPMPDSFARAAFALEPNQISEPTVTAFGIHLIKCLEIRPGQKRWQDVRAELGEAITQYLFDWAANQVLPQARVDYSSAFPHFKPGTEILVPGVPGKDVEAEQNDKRSRDG